MIRRPPRSTLFPYTTLFRSWIVTGPPTDAAAGPAAHLQQYIFIQVDTDEGLTGWGEVTTYPGLVANRDRKSTRLNSSYANISYAVFCLKKNTNTPQSTQTQS